MLDTHVLVRWLAEPKRLSRHQIRVLDEAVRRGEQVALSAVTLLELAILLTGDHPRIHANAGDLFSDLTSNPAFRILPLTVEVAAEVVLLGHVLRDQWDRAIVATARVHRLGLLTSDQRIIESKMVSVIE